MRNNGATAKEDANEIDVDYLLPCIEGVFPGLEVRPGDARAGDQNVDFVVLEDRIFRCSYHAIRLGNVDGFY